MPAHEYLQQLENVVESILANTSLKGFAEHWKLGRELLNGVPIQAFYARIEDNYANMAVLTDKLVIDLEESDNNRNPGGVGIAMIRYIGLVDFRNGPVRTIPGSETSKLTIVTVMNGAAAGPYWIAKTNKEYEDLIRFGKALLNAVNTS